MHCPYWYMSMVNIKLETRQWPRVE
jgi:hypothetical protein